MEELFKVETTSHYSYFYKLKIPNYSDYKVRFDFSKSKEKNTRIFLLNNFQWSLIIEERYYINNNAPLDEHAIKLKIQEYSDKFYKLVCV